MIEKGIGGYVMPAENPFTDPAQEYICSPVDISLQGLSEKWHKEDGDGYSYSVLTKRSADENWREQRENFQKEYSKDFQQRIIRSLNKGRVTRLRSYLGVVQAIMQDAYTLAFKERDLKKNEKALVWKGKGEAGRIAIQAAEALKGLEQYIQESGERDDQVIVKLPGELEDDYAKSVSELQADTSGIADAPESGEIQSDNSGKS